MDTIKLIFKKIKVKPIPAILGLISISVSPIIAKILNSFIQWLALDPNANISALLIIVFIVIIISLVELFYVLAFGKELINPLDIYPYDEETNTCLDKNNNKRYCPTGISDNKKHPVRKENGVWICCNKNCKNSISLPISKQW